MYPLLSAVLEKATECKIVSSIHNKMGSPDIERHVG
jgi:hypothetical protein